ncbi:MAG: signal peptide peptidase SppA [Nitrospiraceae bacterium]|jgi:protease-4|nr:signal peptide peptidase SppA [Nitrospiraceae bacterium]
MKLSKAAIIAAAFLVTLLLLSVLLTLVQKDVAVKDRVALVRVEGPLIEAKSTIDELKGYVKDKSIKAIVLRVNSPGGGVVPSQEIFDEVKKAVATKKVVVSMGSVAASGGYYISAPASRIIANPGTITGSIGVIMEVPNFKGLFDKIGVRSEVIKSGKHKDIASVFRGIGDEERKIVQGVMDDVHDQFIKAVAEGRNMPVEQVRKIADGRIFSGNQAKQAGLVDDLGDLEYAIAQAAKMAGIKGEPEVVTKKEKHALMELLKGQVPEGFLKYAPNLELKYQYMP